MERILKILGDVGIFPCVMHSFIVNNSHINCWFVLELCRQWLSLICTTSCTISVSWYTFMVTDKRALRAYVCGDGSTMCNMNSCH